MSDSLYLAWHYLRHHQWTTSLLVGSIALILYLPAALQTIVSSAEQHFRSRADSTPLVVGPRGSSLELVLRSVYFAKPSDDVVPLTELSRVEKQQNATTIPMHLKFRALETQVVGTTKTYFEERKLAVSSGGLWEIPGECVIGSRVADRLGLHVGDRIPVANSTAFVLGDKPLRLRVVGLLRATETPDDEAIFTNLDTCWIAEGLGHGHLKGAKHGSSESKPFTDITRENLDSFHFHGRRDTFPISAILVIPDSEKAKTILLGQYFSPEERMQIVRPREAVNLLMSRVLMVRSYLLAAIALTSLVTLIMMGLVIALSIRLRRSELATMWKLGCARHTLGSILGSQIMIVVAAGAAVALVLTAVTRYYGPELVRVLIL